MDLRDMAQYHKIPQNVTTYEGRIVGKFTAKQFIFLAIGAISVFLITNTPLGKNIKIVLSAIIGGTSLLLALANYDGRSTDTWISTFLQVVYQPTQRLWRKSATPPVYLLPTYHPQQQKRAPRKRTVGELNELLDIWRPTTQNSLDLSESEKGTLNRIRGIREKYGMNTSLSGDAPPTTEPEQLMKLGNSHG